MQGLVLSYRMTFFIDIMFASPGQNFDRGFIPLKTTRHKGSNGRMMQVDLYGFQLIGDLPPSEGTGELI